MPSHAKVPSSGKNIIQFLFKKKCACVCVFVCAHTLMHSAHGAGALKGKASDINSLDTCWMARLHPKNLAFSNLDCRFLYFQLQDNEFKQWEKIWKQFWLIKSIKRKWNSKVPKTNSPVWMPPGVKLTLLIKHNLNAGIKLGWHVIPSSFTLGSRLSLHGKHNGMTLFCMCLLLNNHPLSNLKAKAMKLIKSIQPFE